MSISKKGNEKKKITLSEQEINELAKRYGQDPETIRLILLNYDSIEDFMNSVVSGYESKDPKLEGIMKRMFDVDRNQNSENYERLMSEIYGSQGNDIFFFYSSNDLAKTLSTVLTPLEAKLIVEKFGIEMPEPELQDTDELKNGKNKEIKGAKKERIIDSALDKLRNFEIADQFLFTDMATERDSTFSYVPKSIYVSDEEREIVKKFKSEIEKSNIMFNPSIDPQTGEKRTIIPDMSEERIQEGIDFLRRVREDIPRRKESQHIELTMDTSLDELCDKLKLSVRDYNCLKRDGVEKLGDLYTYSVDQWVNIRNLGLKTLLTLMIKLTKAGVILPIDYNELIEKASEKHEYLKSHYTASQTAGLKTLLSRQRQVVNPETLEAPENPDDPDDIDL